MLYFELRGKDGNSKGAEAAERFVDHIADKSYTITLAVSLGPINTLIESPFSMTMRWFQRKRRSGRGCSQAESGSRWDWKTGTISLRTWKMR
jgi:cystathionine beta-lyase/cystathionine gamma-synthase